MSNRLLLGQIQSSHKTDLPWNKSLFYKQFVLYKEFQGEPVCESLRLPVGDPDALDLLPRPDRVRQSLQQEAGGTHRQDCIRQISSGTNTCFISSISITNLSAMHAP